MTDLFRQYAICPCGWINRVSFGSLAHLTGDDGQFTNVCPSCGRSKKHMTVRTLRWEDGTYRDRDGKPYDEREPTPAKPADTFKIGPQILTAALVLALIGLVIWG